MALMQEKKGGPYTKKQREERLEEVHKLHFEYGFSAIHIAKMMNVNKNTINNDISSLYAKLNEDMDKETWDSWLNKQFFRLESQRAMLQMELDKNITLGEKLQISKMIQNLDWKITSLVMRMKTIEEKGTEMGILFLNHWLKKNGHSVQYMTKDSLYKIPEEKREKIFKLLYRE